MRASHFDGFIGNLLAMHHWWRVDRSEFLFSFSREGLLL